MAKPLRVDDNIVQAVDAWIKFGLPAGSCTSLLLAGKYDEALLHAHELIKPVWDDHIAYIESVSAECRGANMAAWGLSRMRQRKGQGKLADLATIPELGVETPVSVLTLGSIMKGDSVQLEHVRGGVRFRFLDKKAPGRKVVTQLSSVMIPDLRDLLEAQLKKQIDSTAEQTIFDAYPLKLCCLGNFGASNRLSIACHYSIEGRCDFSEVLLSNSACKNLMEYLGRCLAIDADVPGPAEFGL